MSNPADPSFNHYSLTDLFAITEELEFEGDYISPPEPDLTAYAEAINKVAHQAAVDSNYHPHKIDAVIHKVEVNAYYHNLVVRGLIAMAGGIQPEADPLVAPQGQGLWPQIDAEITARINAIYPGSIPYGEFDLAERFIRSRGDEFRYCAKDWRYFKGVGW